MTDELKPSVTNSLNTATKRTGVNLAASSAVVGAAAYLIEKTTGYKFPELDLVALAPLFPVVGVVGAILYRASRYVSDRFPAIGLILFGSKVAPNNYTEPKKEG